jgi:hypothetical protein
MPRLHVTTVVCAAIAVAALCFVSLQARGGPQGAAAQAPPKAEAPVAATPQAPAAARGEVLPDMKAYQDAVKISDVDKKIEALAKVKADFPDSPVVDMADSQILGALVKRAGDATKSVLDQAAKMAEREAGPRRGAAAVASSLLNANLLLDEAERFAEKGVAELKDEQAYIEARRKDAARQLAESAKRNPDAATEPLPDDATLQEGYRSTLQSALNTLAQIYDKRGKAAAAEKTFLESYRISARGATGATAALKLAEYAKAAGREADQFEYLTTVAVAGRLKAPDRATYEALYTKLHGGTLDGLETMLDARYVRENPMPVHVTPYVRTKDRTSRVVLAEIFTGAGCPPCVGVDYAFEGALERYQPSELAVLMYHLHIPQPDPLTNPSTLKRAEFYAIRGTPTTIIDGQERVGGGSASMAPKIYKDTVEPAIEKRLTTRPGARVGLSASRETGDRVRARVSVDRAPREAAKLRLHVVLAEERVRYSGENGVRFHPMVVRGVAAAAKDTQGFAVTGGKPLTIEYVFDVKQLVEDAKAHLDNFEVNSPRFGKFQFMAKKHDIDPATLLIVAYVQNEETKDVLQAAVVRVVVP